MAPTKTQLGIGAGAVLAFLFWAAFALTVRNPVVVNDEVLFYLTGVAGRALGAARRSAAAVEQTNALLYPEIIALLKLLPGTLPAKVKLFNVAAFLSGALVLIGMCGAAEGKWRGLALAALLLFTPFAAYAAYLMPETLYFAVFAAAVAALAWPLREEPPRIGARLTLAGGLLGLLTLVKPHGLEPLAGLEAAIVVRGALDRTRPAAILLRVALSGAGFAAVFLLVRLLITPPGLDPSDLMGADYRAQLRALGDPQRLSAGVALVFRYLAALLALYAPALAALALESLRPRGATSPEADATRLAGTLCLATLLLLVLTAPLVVSSEPNRIHLRYLSFAALAALALAARLRGEAEPAAGPRLRAVTAGLWTLGALVLVFGGGGFRPLGADSPDLFALYSSGEFGGFGLGGAAPVLFAALVLALSGLVLVGGLHWLTAQIALLALVAVVAIPNVHAFDGALAEIYRPGRELGFAARDRCGPGASDVRMIAPGTNFVPLYPAAFTLGRASPFVIVPAPLPAPAPVLPRTLEAPRGACVLTTVELPAAEFDLLTANSGGFLYRRRDARGP